MFGTKHFTKFLKIVRVSDHATAVLTLLYEVQAREEDPVYGCYSQIFALQQQVANLKSHIASLQEQLNQSFLSGSGFLNYPIN